MSNDIVAPIPIDHYSTWASELVAFRAQSVTTTNL